jgi:hypothetical protein
MVTTTAPTQPRSNPLYTPHSGQWEVHQNKAQVKVLHVARRWGKSRMALFEMLNSYQMSLDIEAPSSLVPPWHCWIVCPSYPQANQTWTELMAFIPPDWIAPNGARQDQWQIRLKGSQKRKWGLIEVKSAVNVDSLQTVGLNFLWVNESQDIPDLAFEKLLPTTRTPDRITYQLYEGIPPLFPDHWFQKLYELGQRDSAKNYFSYKATVYENPLLTAEQIAEIELDREVLREASWRRMYLAEYSESAGFFSKIDDNTVGNVQDAPIPGVRYVAGLDLGKKHDASVLTILEAKGRKVVAAYVWDAGENWVTQRESINHWSEFWGLERIIVDSTGLGDVFFDELSNMGAPAEAFVISGSEERTSLLNLLAVAMENSTVSYPDIPTLRRQLRAVQPMKTASGKYRPDVPSGEHDDYVFSFALGLTACDSPVQLSAHSRITKMSYGPTGSKLSTSGQARMRLRQSAKLKERLERAGVLET